MRWLSLYPTRFVQHEWQKRWGARVEKRAGGRIKLEIYPASQIGSIMRGSGCQLIVTTIRTTLVL